MRILIVNYVLNDGGVAQSSLKSASTLESMGHEIFFFIPKSASWYTGNNSRIKLYYDLYLSSNNILKKIIFSIKIRFFAKNNDIDIIISHNSRYIFYLKNFIQFAPLIAVVHGGSIKRFKKADYFAAVNPKISGRLIELGAPPEKIFVIPPSFVAPRDQQDHFKKPDQGVIFGAVGALVTSKGYEILFNALKGVGQAKKWRLEILGDGPLKDHLAEDVFEKGLSDHVIFHGWKNKQDIDLFLNRIDCFISASISETFGMALLEAMERFLPIIATNSDGSRYVLDDDRLIPIADSTALRAAIQKFLDEGDVVAVEKYKKQLDLFSENNFRNQWKLLLDKIEH